jgi:hypothetical protein
MQLGSRILATTLAGAIGVPLPLAESAARDLWIHPRGESFDAARHYRAADGELYYLEENDLGLVGPVHIEAGENPRLRVQIGADLRRIEASGQGSLLPVLLWDEDGDGGIDRLARGRVEGGEVVYDGPELAGVDFAVARWQLGVRYQAGATGKADLDGRYLASVEGSRAEVVRIPATPDVAARAPAPGLVILKHREGEPFDLADFARRPAAYAESFDPLTREADGDDWTVTDGEGVLTTHFEREDLFIVRTQGGLGLQVTAGDLPLERFLGENLDVPAGAGGCYGTHESRLLHDDGTPVTVPTRILWCPDRAMALLESPDGYEFTLSALRAGEVVETTEVGNSIRDNLKLYSKEINPRQPSRRATGTIGGNLAAGVSDAGADLGDAFRHAFVGTRDPHLHTGRRSYKPSLLTAAPLALYKLVTLHPLEAGSTLLAGAESGVQAGADVVSAVNNSAVNGVLQLSVGLVSVAAADRAGDVIGTTSQALVKNLPLGERSNGVIDLRGAWYHDRAFEPPRHTRTDTQLNVDRAATIVDLAALNAIRLHNEDSGGGATRSNDGGGSGGAGGGGGVPNPTGGGGGGGLPGVGGGAGGGGGGGMGKCVDVVRHARQAKHAKHLGHVKHFEHVKHVEKAAHARHWKHLKGLENLF